ncbi:MAG: hypothetical protein EOM83_04645 [Clostridia bacterium]|nr:hypothetical protein [Clostridia bacterium]
MDSQFKSILSNLRMLAIREGIANLTLESICERLNISPEILGKYVKNERELVTRVLDFERSSFMEIFDEFDFEGMNAIDILLIVSREIASRYYDVTPTISVMLKERFPKIYQLHFQKRSDFIFKKIQINLQKGISQGMYRDDLSIELVSRLYMSRLIDIHNEEIFPSDQFSFETIYEVMIDNFVRSLATTEGLKYFELKRSKKSKPIK